MPKVITDSSTTLITEKETLEFFNEGLKKAAACAREMASLQSNPIWLDVGKLLDEMRNSGLVVANSKAMGRQDVLENLRRRETAAGVKSDAAANKGKIILN